MNCVIKHELMIVNQKLNSIISILFIIQFFVFVNNYKRILIVNQKLNNIISILFIIQFFFFVNNYKWI